MPHLNYRAGDVISEKTDNNAIRIKKDEFAGCNVFQLGNHMQTIRDSIV